MKHGSFKAVCFILMASIAVASVFSDEYTVNLESRILEAFNGDSDYEWDVVASRFATQTDEETFPKITYVSAWPAALYGQRPTEEPQSFGVWGRFDRRGYNWIDIYPTQGGEAVEIPIPGRAQYFDLWVWGSNLNFYMEAYVRDYQGVPHIINMGSLGYTGWRNLRATVPNTIAQSKRVLPRLAGLTFIKFRIWTQPVERVDNFYIYFNQFKVLTDTFESIFDGDDLANAEKVQELWSGSSN